MGLETLEKDGEGSLCKKLRLENEATRFFVSAFMVTCFMGVLLFCFNVRFESNDDSGLRSILAGYISGSPYPVTIFLSVIFGRMVTILYEVFPGAPWYPIVFLFLIYISNIIILKSLIKKTFYNKRSLRYALVLYCMFFSAFMAYYVVLLQFTVVAAICASACCGLILAREERDTTIVKIFDCISFFILFFFAVSIRYMSVLAIAPFFALSFLQTLLKDNESEKNIDVLKMLILKILSIKTWKLLLPYMASILFVIAIVFGYDTNFMNQNPDWQEFSKFNIQRGIFTDFPHPRYDEAPKLYSEVGWSSDLVRVMSEWFMLDERITKENLAHINAGDEAFTQENGQHESTSEGFFETVAEKLFSKQPYIGLGFSVILWGSAAIIYLAIISKRIYLVWCSSLNIIASFSLLILLIFSGRAPLRAVFCILIPAVLLLLFQIIEFPYEKIIQCKGDKKVSKPLFVFWSILTWIIVLQVKAFGAEIKPIVFLISTSILLFVFLSKPLLKWIYNCKMNMIVILFLPVILFMGQFSVELFKNNTFVNNLYNARDVDNHYKMVEQYVAQYPQNIYLYDLSSALLYQRDPFYVPEGKPPINYMMFGGSLTHSPLYMEQLKSNNRTELWASQFKDDGIYLLYPMMDKEAKKEEIVDRIKNTRLYFLLKNDYGIENVEIVDTIDEMYYVYRFR